jgi:type II secretory pathway predicted ATPase ExeA
VPELDLNETFLHALRLMEETEKSLFVTGKAGTGKSTLLQYFCAHTEKNPVVLAPTGVAALNVGGRTIHHFFGFSIDVTVQKIREKKIRPRNTKLYKKLRTIVIDESSMLRADLLDCVDAALRLYLSHSRP